MKELRLHWLVSVLFFFLVMPIFSFCHSLLVTLIVRWTMIDRWKIWFTSLMELTLMKRCWWWRRPYWASWSGPYQSPRLMFFLSVSSRHPSLISWLDSYYIQLSASPWIHALSINLIHFVCLHVIFFNLHRLRTWPTSLLSLDWCIMPVCSIGHQFLLPQPFMLLGASCIGVRFGMKHWDSTRDTQRHSCC